jgi:site-specific DNA-methyltransferase (adenine-specific)
MKLTDKIEITNEDNMVLMARYPDKYFDLAIVDPPYGIGFAGFDKHYGGGKAKAKTTLHKPFAGGDKKSPDNEYFIELLRVSKNQIIWGANHFISKIPFDSSCWVIWNKINGDNPFADAELAWTSFETAVRIFEFKWQGMLQGDMKNKETRIHPTQKPVALYKWLLDKYAKQSDKILDTHLGSGSIAIACHDYGFDLTACELDKEYFDKAIKRINNHVAQLKLI